jgi:hypothetical protein
MEATNIKNKETRPSRKVTQGGRRSHHHLPVNDWPSSTDVDSESVLTFTTVAPSTQDDDGAYDADDCSDNYESSPHDEVGNGNRTSSDDDSFDISDDEIDNDDDDDDDDALSFQIDYLRQKSALLQRAFGRQDEEQQHLAATARQVLLHSQSDDQQSSTSLSSLTSTSSLSSSSSSSISSLSTSSIWKRARATLQEMGSHNGTADVPNKKVRTMPTKGVTNPKDYRIDISLVTNHFSKEENSQFPLPRRVSTMTSDHCQLYDEAVFSSAWMNEALLPDSPFQQMFPSSAGVPILDNTIQPIVGLLEGYNETQHTPSLNVNHVFPAPSSTFTSLDAIDIGEALMLSNVPRIITQASSPFTIVHVNKAFLEIYYYSLGSAMKAWSTSETNTKQSLIGQTLDSLIHVVTDSKNEVQSTSPKNTQTSHSQNIHCELVRRGTNKSSSMNSKIEEEEEKEDRVSCTMCVTPVVDRISLQRDVLSDSLVSSETSPSSMKRTDSHLEAFANISHLMIRIHPDLAFVAPPQTTMKASSLNMSLTPTAAVG